MRVYFHAVRKEPSINYEPNFRQIPPARTEGSRVSEMTVAWDAFAFRGGYLK